MHGDRADVDIKARLVHVAYRVVQIAQGNGKLLLIMSSAGVDRVN